MDLLEGKYRSQELQDNQLSHETVLNNQSSKCVAIFCSICNREDAEFVNLGAQYKKRRFLCTKCLENRSQIFLIPLKLQKANQLPEQSPIRKFMKNITTNKDHPDAAAYRQNIEVIFREQIDTKINEYCQIFLETINSWKKSFIRQFHAVANTFDSQIITKFLNKIQTDTKDPELNSMIDAMTYAGCRDFSQIDLLIECVNHQFKTVGTLLQKEIDQIGKRFEVLQKVFAKCRIGKAYDKKRQAKKKQSQLQKQTENASSPDAVLIQLDEPTVCSNQKTVRFDINEQNSVFFKEQTSLSKDINALKISSIKAESQDTITNTLFSIADLTQVQFIHIQEPIFTRRNRILFLFELFKNLTMVSLDGENQFDEKCLKFVLKNIPHIKWLYLGCHFHQRLAQIDQEAIFRTSRIKKNSRKRPLCLEETQKLTELEYLQNIWVAEGFNSTQICQKVYKMKRLKHLVLGHYQQQERVRLSIDDWEYISQKDGLVSIAFIKIELNPLLLNNLLIRNRQTIETLYFCKRVFYADDCKHFKDSIFTTIKQHLTNMKEFQLQICTQVGLNGENLCAAQSLSTLILSKKFYYPVDCKELRISGGEMKLYCLRRLKHLNLSGCEWAVDMVFMRIRDLKELQFLSVCHTQIVSFFGFYIQELKNLRALDIGSTKINLQHFTELIKSHSKLEKLSISNLRMKESGINPVINIRYLLEAGKHLSKLTHLDISSNADYDESMWQALPMLKHVTAKEVPDLCEFKIKSLNSQQIFVYNE